MNQPMVRILGQWPRGSAAATEGRIVVDAYGHWLALRRGLVAARQQRQKRRRAQDHDYDVRFH
jgi:hypothetical protein